MKRNHLVGQLKRDFGYPNNSGIHGNNNSLFARAITLYYLLTKGKRTDLTETVLNKEFDFLDSEEYNCFFNSVKEIFNPNNVVKVITTDKPKGWTDGTYTVMETENFKIYCNHNCSIFFGKLNGVLNLITINRKNISDFNTVLNDVEVGFLLHTLKDQTVIINTLEYIVTKPVRYSNLKLDQLFQLI